MAEKLVHTGYGNGQSNFPIKVYVTYSSTQDIASNTSTLTCGMYVTTPGSKWTIGAWKDFYGSYVGSKSNTFNGTIPSFGGKRTLTSGQTFKVNHNSDGTGSATIYWKWGVDSSWGRIRNISGSFTVSLPTIPRQANLTAAPNFNDEQNPTIIYSNPAGNAVTSLDACISFTGSKDDIAYRAISKTGTSYTFSLTEAERNVLRNGTTGANSRNVTFYVRTVLDGTTFYSTITKTLYIVNANPSLSPTVVDSNATTKALTGDANKLVKYYSNAQYSIGAGARKGASLSSQKVVHNGVTKTSATGTYNAVENASFYFEAKDSRGKVSSTTINKTLINYVKLSCNYKVGIDVDGNARFTINGNYFNGSFGAVANTLTVQYRYKVEGGSYSSWTNATASKSGNTYTSTPVISGLNYQKAYTFQVRVIDKLATVTAGEITTKAIPVFDWGENDFKFNVDVFDKNGNKLGTEMTAENQSAVAVTGRMLQETGFVSITPVANTPTSAAVKFKKTYKKIPTIVMSVASGVPGTQVLGYGQTGISTTGVNIVVTRTNTAPTILYYYVFGEVAD